ncbi:DUF4097 family beta strand repeat-containing protein [Corallococcus macrosporus]|uniref:DUF4097 family beta strand repeat-containing protein n=1 Tax=Corallococcus macrosporus TaxID=35 RepID=UPI0023D8E9F5|nr:DUF4097 family beta strand repeat-containing protein [Corallococcus macrosporus]
MVLPLLLVLAAAPSTQTWNFNTDGTPEVHIANVDGVVRVDAVDGNGVVFEVVREGGKNSRNEVEVEVVQEGDVIRARVCCGPCEEDVQVCRRSPGAVRFSVKVPRGARLEVATVGGPVTVTGVAGAQTLATVSGRVEVSGSEERLDVSTVNGAVALAPRKVVTTSVSTVNGDVRLKLPARADVRLEFNTVGGRFNDSPARLGGREQTYGAGTHAVEVSTVGGSLSVQP